MGMYSVIKNRVTTKYPDVMAEYSEWIIAHGNATFMGKVRAYSHLLCMLLKHKSGGVKIQKSEYEDCKREDVAMLTERVKEYDIISFDVFDTLILRNIERPEDVFDLVGYIINMEDFGTARKDIEKSLSQSGNYSIFDIYADLELQRGITKEILDKEFKIEKKLCQMNPYIKEVYDVCVQAGKKVIAVSDMYWPKEYIEEILRSCGYSEIKDIYVSCDYAMSKKDGTIFKLLKEKEYSNKKIIHIGDNYNADVVQAKKNGIASIQYISVYEQGRKYRHTSYEKQTLGQSVVNAIINNEIHNGICKMDKYEQFGFIYGGPLVAGYCKFINKKAEEKKIDKLLFVARDADVIYQSYQKFYDKYDCEYVYASRNAVAQLAFEKYPDYFIEKVLQLRFIEKTKEYSIEEVLKQTGLQCLLEKLKEINLSKDMVFEQNAMQKMIELIYRYKDLIVEAFAPVREAACLYWKQVIGDAKRIAFIDIGWQASTMMCMDYFLKEVCNLSADLYTIQLGTMRTKWNNAMIEKDKILSYCFSDDCNKRMGDLLMYHPVRVHIIEIMFAAPHPTLISYKKDEKGQGVPLFADVISENISKNKKIQSGILKFVSAVYQTEKNLECEFMLQGDKVFQSVIDMSAQKRYAEFLFDDYYFSNVPCDAQAEKMGKFIRKNM